MKLHWPYLYGTGAWSKRITACGIHQSNSNMAERAADVDCKRCRKRIDDPEMGIRATARDRGYSAALRRLRDNHPEEFDIYRKEETQKAMKGLREKQEEKAK